MRFRHVHQGINQHAISHDIDGINRRNGIAATGLINRLKSQSYLGFIKCHSLDVSYRHRRIVILIYWMQVKHSVMPPGERVERQIEAIDSVIAVVEATPTPVDVEEIPIVISVDHIGMTANIALRSIIQRHASIQVIHHILFPTIRILLVVMPIIGTESEIAFHGRANIL